MEQQLKLTLPRPHQAQLRVIAESKRFNVVCAGRRFGKSFISINRLADTSIKRRLPAAYMLPNYRMLSDVWRECLNLFKPVITRMNVQERRLELITGAVIDFWSLDSPDTIRGRKYALALVDEAAHVPDLENAWQAIIRPTLTDMQGAAWFMSTPNGTGYFKTLFDRGQDPLNIDWRSWRFPTTANPFISPLEVESARQELPRRVFEQEYLAEFQSGEGSVFRNIRACATGHRVEPYQGRFVMGLDWGQTNDATFITVMDATTHALVDLDRFTGIGWELQRGRVITMAKKWGVGRIIAESNSIGSPNIEALQRDGLPVMPFVTTASSKPPLIESLALAFEKTEITILPDSVLISELENYERTANQHTGRPQYSAPTGGHDDGVISLALAWHGLQARQFHAVVGGERPHMNDYNNVSGNGNPFPAPERGYGHPPGRDFGPVVGGYRGGYEPR